MTILKDVIHLRRPHAGFYLWLKTPIDDTRFARDLYLSQNVTVLPGSFLSREVDHYNPGYSHIRLALVASLKECTEAATRIKYYIQTLN